MSNDKLAEALGFLDRVHRGLISGRISEWPGLREACGIVYAAHATESAQAQAQSVVWSIPEARPKVTVDHDSVECGDLYTLEDACWNAGWNACREAMLAAAPQQAAEPVVWMTPTKNYFGSFEGCTDVCNGAPIPLYTHPQPAQDAKDAEGCVWSEDEEGNWDTGCGHMFVINEGTPYDNEMGFCCYCGGKLDQVTQAEAAIAKESGR